MNEKRLADLTYLRQELHKIPEVSGQEEKTAALITSYLRDRRPDQLMTGLGGHGVAGVFWGKKPGPTVLFRCELDGLPIEECSGRPYSSTHEGRGHLCGHDGHMTMVAALADGFAMARPERGRIVLLFQPAEETGKGAAAVLSDPRFDDIRPDFSFSLHNLPGLPIGSVAMPIGPANCASRGMRLHFKGKTSHAAAPQDGISPAGAMARLMPALVRLGSGSDLGPDFTLVTLTHAWLGEATFGISPGEAEIWITLRTVTDTKMEDLIDKVEDLANATCIEMGLKLEIDFDDVFEACSNHPEASAIVSAACAEIDQPLRIDQLPQLWSEDFGQFGKVGKSAMFWLGSGTQQPQLHNPDYDFPDNALPVGIAVFSAIAKQILS